MQVGLDEIQKILEPDVVSDEAEHNLLASPVEGTKATQTHLILVSRPDHTTNGGPPSSTKLSVWQTIIDHKVIIEQNFGIHTGSSSITKLSLNKSLLLAL